MTEANATRRATLAGVAGLSLGAAALAGCSNTSGTGANSTSQTSGPPQPAKLTFTPKNESSGIMPEDKVSVRAASGKIISVKCVTEGGNELPGKIEGDTWTADADTRLFPTSTYHFTVRAEGPTGDKSTVKSSFSTMVPQITATVGVNYNGVTVGVAMPVTILFESEVSPEFRADVERSLTVTNSAKVEGAWGWLDGRQLMWRPKDYWPAGTSIKLKGAFHGLQTGANKWCVADIDGSMYIGRNQVSTVNMKTYTMTVSRAGSVIKSIPVSTGRPGPDTETRSGNKVIITKEASIWMDSTSIGIPKGQPGYYRKLTNFNMRVTWTGEYLHSAPWSVNSQGTQNVSHGCTNMSPENAQWMYDNSLVGDPVIFTGSNRAFLPTEGIGVWQYDYAGWQKQSALA